MLKNIGYPDSFWFSSWAQGVWSLFLGILGHWKLMVFELQKHSLIQWWPSWQFRRNSFLLPVEDGPDSHWYRLGSSLLIHLKWDAFGQLWRCWYWESNLCSPHSFWKGMSPITIFLYQQIQGSGYFKHVGVWFSGDHSGAVERSLLVLEPSILIRFLSLWILMQLFKVGGSRLL